VDLAFFGVAKVEMFLLVLARTAGIFTLVPIFGSSQVPAQVRLGIAVGMALIFVPLYAPAGQAPVATGVFSMALLIAKEALVGMVIGFVTVMVFSAIQAAGDYIDMAAGFSFAAMFDPIYGTNTAIAGRFHHILAGLIFFVTNAHHIMLSGLADSFRVVPVGSLSFAPSVAGGVFELFVILFAVAVRIAAPVVVAVFLADVAMAVVAKAVPQMNILMVGLPLKLGVGMVGMVIALPVAMAMSRNALGDIGPQATSLLRLLTAH
jgi:flagellar biosynthesis protein FliR